MVSGASLFGNVANAFSGAISGAAKTANSALQVTGNIAAQAAQAEANMIRSEIGIIKKASSAVSDVLSS